MLHDPYSGHDGMMGGMGQQPDRRDLKIGKIWNLLVLIIVAQCVGCLVDFNSAKGCTRGLLPSR